MIVAAVGSFYLRQSQNVGYSTDILKLPWLQDYLKDVKFCTYISRIL